MIQYEQICIVKLPTTRTRSFVSHEAEELASGSIEVDYYLYDGQTGALNLSRLRSIVLPKTEDDVSLCDEIRRRSFGPAPSRQARIGLVVWQLFRITLMLLAVPLYILVVGVIVVIVT